MRKCTELAGCVKCLQARAWVSVLEKTPVPDIWSATLKRLITPEGPHFSCRLLRPDFPITVAHRQIPHHPKMLHSRQSFARTTPWQYLYWASYSVRLEGLRALPPYEIVLWVTLQKGIVKLWGAFLEMDFDRKESSVEEKLSSSISMAYPQE